MRFTKRGNVEGTKDDFHSRMKKQVDGTENCIRNYNLRACIYQEKLGGGVSAQYKARAFSKYTEWQKKLRMNGQYGRGARNQLTYLQVRYSCVNKIFPIGKNSAEVNLFILVPPFTNRTRDA